MNKIIKFLKSIDDIIVALIVFAWVYTAIFIESPVYRTYIFIYNLIYSVELEAQDMNPIKAPRSSRYQVENTGFQLFRIADFQYVKGIGLKRAEWYYILDSSDYCYRLHTESNETNIKLFRYIAQKSPYHDSDLIALDNFKILYLRGTLQDGRYDNQPKLKETVEEQRKAMSQVFRLKQSKWDCTNQMPEIDIIEIKYEYNNQIYHFKINDELEKQFQNDLVYTFK